MVASPERCFEMPIVCISLVPPGLGEDAYSSLIGAVHEAVLGIPELGLTEPHEVTVLLPPDLSSMDLGECEIVAQVTGLLNKPERTKEVKEAMCAAIADAILAFTRLYVPDCPRVEVINLPFRQDNDGSCVRAA